MAEFSDKQKERIVVALARFVAPSAIVADFKAEGVETDYRQIVGYDPTRPYYEAGDKWRELFDAQREIYLKDVQAVPVANQGYRLNLLQRGIEAAEKKGNWVLAASLAEQAAKEVGGALTNERINRTSRAPMQPDEMSEAERREVVAGLFRDALAGTGKTVHEGTATQQ